MILGCTHYPIVSNEVKELLPKHVHVIDSPTIIAKHLMSELEKRGLLNNESSVTSNCFQVSDLTDTFRFGAQKFFGAGLDLEEVVLG